MRKFYWSGHKLVILSAGENIGIRAINENGEVNR